MNIKRQTSHQPHSGPERMEITDMKTRTPSLRSMGALLLVLAAVVAVSLLMLASLAQAAPSHAPAAQAAFAGIPISTLPASTCSLVGSTRTCNLWAMTGTITMPTGASVPVWGFADSPAGPAQVPGPMLIANDGETLEVVLHNQLPGETVSLAFPGQQGLFPDLVGVGTGSMVTYTFPVSNAGTYLYEAGLTPNGSRQVAMGLHGALIVRPAAAGQAYDSPATAYDDEVLLVLSEIDPLFNIDPYGFPIHQYAPRYWLINGKAYPETVTVDTHAGNTVLLRYVNAGLKSHWMGLLGLRQQIIGSDGRPRTLPYQVVAGTVASGQTVDALVMIPSSAVTETRYALYDTNMLLHNAGHRDTPAEPLDFGGMMTFIRAVSGTAQFEAGPVATVSVDPSNTTGMAGVTLTVRLDDTANGGQNVILAEYFTATIGPVETGIDLPVGAPAPVVTLTEFIPAATLAGWPSGYPIFYVRGKDANGSWGLVGSAVLNLDKLGPKSTALSLSPEPTNGQSAVLLRATGDDHTTGHNNVVSGTFSIDGGASLPLSLSRTDAPIVAMTATLASDPTLMGMAEGLHPIAVSAQDSLGTWGAPSVITLTLDRTGPAAPIVTLTPSTLDLTGAPVVTHVKLQAVMTDALSNGVQSTVADAEAFIGQVGPEGTGFALFPSDGLFDQVSEAAYFDIPIANFVVMAQGVHTVTVRGLDVAGNWGALGSANITIDRGATDTEGPTISALAVVPNPTDGAPTVTLTAAAQDPGALSNVTAAEWFVGADPGLGGGISLPASDGAFDSPSEALITVIDVSSWSNGGHLLSVRARDSLANWGALASIRLQVRGNNPLLIMADSFEAGNLAAWSAAVGQVAVVPEAAMAPDGGTLGLRAIVDGGQAAYVSHLMPAGETSYHASFYFDPNGTDMGNQHHEILVGLNAGTPIFGIRCEASTNGGAYEVQGWALVDGILTYTGWYDIADAAQKLGVNWKASTAGSFSLSIDDTVVEELTDLNTAAYMLHEIRLGPSANLDPAMSGAEYFDGFEATRTIYVYLPTVQRDN
jgi:FtsP/CotA-like multicopper oxidase with cupredoxin domain